MPKTAVHEHRQPTPRQYKIWGTSLGNSSLNSNSATGGMNRLAESDLWPCVRFQTAGEMPTFACANPLRFHAARLTRSLDIYCGQGVTLPASHNGPSCGVPIALNCQVRADGRTGDAFDESTRPLRDTCEVL